MVNRLPLRSFLCDKIVMLRRKPLLITSLLAAGALGGCATTAPDADPLGGYNRAMFGANRALDKAVLRPGAVPWPVREGMRRPLPQHTLQGPHGGAACMWTGS